MKKKEKRKIKIQLDFLAGPIWCDYIDVEEGRELTDIDIIDDNEEIQKLNKEIQEKYSAYYEIESHDEPCYFNEEKEYEEKDEMLELISRLKKMLEEINDGSFEIVDLESERIKSLKKPS